MKAFGCALYRFCHSTLFLALLVTAVLLTASAQMLEREWAAWLGQRVPISWVQTASMRTLARLDASVLTPSTLSVERQNTLNSKLSSLHIPRAEPLLYELVFRHGGGLGAQNFTLAGGQIVVTDEWVQQFSNDRALLTALTVQLGHVLNRDALRSTVERAPIEILVALFRGDAQTGVRLMSEAQPLMVHDARYEEEAQAFSQSVLAINP